MKVSVSDGKESEDCEIFDVSFTPDEGEVPDAIEYQALVDLYNSTNGDGWANDANWMQGNTNADFATAMVWN